MDTQATHYEDPDRPGRCAVCGCVYPCPGTATEDEKHKILERHAGL